MLHASSKHPDSAPRIIPSPLRRNATLMIVRRFGEIGASRAMWSLLSRETCLEERRRREAERPQQRILILFLALALPPMPEHVHALPWSLFTQPTPLLNDAPLMFRVKPPQKLNALT